MFGTVSSASGDKRAGAKGGMGIVRLIIVVSAAVAVLLGVCAAALFIFRIPVAEWALERVLSAKVDGEADVEISALTLDGLSATRLAVKPSQGPASALTGVRVDYNLSQVLRARSADAVSVEAITIEGGRVAVALEEDGVSVFGIALGRNSSGDRRKSNFTPPRLQINDMELAIASPAGEAIALIDGVFDPETGGAVSTTVTAGALTVSAVRLADAAIDAEIVLEKDGRATVAGRAAGAISVAGFSVDDVAFGFAGEAENWRRVIAGDGLGPVRFVATPTDFTVAFEPNDETEDGAVDGDITRTASFLEAARGEGPVSVQAAGALSLHADAAGIRFSVAPALTLQTEPLRAVAQQTLAQGATLTLSGIDNRPVFENGEDVQTAIGFAARLQLDTDGPSAGLEIDADKLSEDAWALTASATFDAQRLFGVDLGAGALSISGETQGTSFDGALKLAAGVREAKISRMAIKDADLLLAAPITGSADDKLVTIGPSCLTAPRGRFSLDALNMDGSLSDGSICADDAPIARLSFANNIDLSVNGVLSAKKATYRFGQTRMRGAPPVFDFDLSYAPTDHRTNLTASYTGGAVVINETVIFSDARGSFIGSLDGPSLGAEFDVTRARVSLAGPQPLAHPVFASAKARLKDRDFSFSGDFRTRGGEKLGRAEGAHAVDAGRGSMTVNTDRLVFVPGGLQPDQLTPLLRGVVSEATGESEAVFNLAWGGGRLTSSGEATFTDVSFRGPGLAVSRTSGVNGTVRFSNLAPITTEGEQTITVDGVDLDALKLTGGAGRFSLPGDNTVRIVEAAFPWFGGTIGAYDTTTPLNGERVETRLEAANVDLSQLFAYLSVDGLSGEGVVEGVLPIIIEDGKARIEGGVLSAVGPGVLKYSGKAGEAAAQSSAEAALAFNVLRDLRYELLEASINGPLDGDIDVGVRFEGVSTVPFEGVSEPVPTPVIYRMNIKAPFLELVRQGRVSTDVSLQYQELRRALEEGVDNYGENSDGEGLSNP